MCSELVSPVWNAMLTLGMTEEEDYLEREHEAGEAAPLVKHLFFSRRT